MAKTSQDELLSAYIDGELSDAQRAEVEERLAKDADARQLVSELRALKESVRSLPAYRLEEDLARRVLQRAERAILTGGVDDEATESEGPPSSSEPPKPWTRPLLRERWRRVYLWPVLAVAATLLIMFMIPNRTARIAQVDQKRMADEAAQKSKSSSTSPAGKVAELSPSAEPVADVEPERFESLRAVPENAKAAPGIPHGLAKQPSVASKSDGTVLGHRFRRKMAGRVESPTEGEEGRLLEEEKAKENFFADDSADQVASQLLIVRVDIAESTIPPDAIAALFSQQGIAFEDVPPQETEARAENADNESDENLERERAAEEASQLGRSADEVELVYVEATAGQLKKTLKALSTDTDRFTSIAIEPAPEVAAQRELQKWYMQRGGEASHVKDRPRGATDGAVADAPATAKSSRAKGAEAEADRKGVLGEKDQLGRERLGRIVASQAQQRPTSNAGFGGVGAGAGVGGGVGGPPGRAQRLSLPPEIKESLATAKNRSDVVQRLQNNAGRNEGAGNEKNSDVEGLSSLKADKVGGKRDEKSGPDRPHARPLVQTLFVFRRPAPAADLSHETDRDETPAKSDQ